MVYLPLFALVVFNKPHIFNTMKNLLRFVSLEFYGANFEIKFTCVFLYANFLFAPKRICLISVGR